MSNRSIYADKEVYELFEILLAAIQELGERVMSALTDLQAQVAQNTSVEASAVQLIQGIAQQLATAIAGGDATQLQALTASLSSTATALAAAITANTPAASADHRCGRQLGNDRRDCFRPGNPRCAGSQFGNPGGRLCSQAGGNGPGNQQQPRHDGPGCQAFRPVSQKQRDGSPARDERLQTGGRIRTNRLRAPDGLR